MKKIFSIIIIALIAINGFAQEEGKSLKSKKGKEILPQTGDFGFGIEGTQFVNYIGNFFNQAGNNSMNLNLPGNSQTFFLKYVANPNTFYRAKLRVGYFNQKDVEFIQDIEYMNDLERTVEDRFYNKNMNIEFAIGIEKRKGENRLQGFYGAEVGVIYSKQKQLYEYGNEIQDGITVPMYSTNFGNNIDFDTHPNDFTMRITNETDGNTLGAGGRLFIGAEYFFAPKISASGEFGWNIAYMNTKEGVKEYEFYNIYSSEIETIEMQTAGGSAFMFDNTPTGLLTLSLYF